MSPTQSQPAPKDAEHAEGHDPRETARDRSSVGEYLERFPAETEPIDRVPREAAIVQVETTRRFVGNYELLEEIGRGGEGIVYRAREQGTSKEVAVKLLLAGAVEFLGRHRASSSTRSRRWPGSSIPTSSPTSYRGMTGVNSTTSCELHPRGEPGIESLEERCEPLDPVHAARLMIQIAKAVRVLTLGRSRSSIAT